MKKLSEHLNESFMKKEPEILYHLSYDIIKNSGNYNEKKNDFYKVIDDTKPVMNENICESTIILGYDNVDFDLFEILEEKLEKDINYCISVVSKVRSKEFEIADSNQLIQKSL